MDFFLLVLMILFAFHKIAYTPVVSIPTKSSHFDTGLYCFGSTSYLRSIAFLMVKHVRLCVAGKERMLCFLPLYLL
jgi:hypothetical protein